MGDDLNFFVGVLAGVREAFLPFYLRGQQQLAMCFTKSFGVSQLGVGRAPGTHATSEAAMDGKASTINNFDADCS